MVSVALGIKEIYIDHWELGWTVSHSPSVTAEGLTDLSVYFTPLDISPLLHQRLQYPMDRVHDLCYINH